MAKKSKQKNTQKIYQKSGQLNKKNEKKRKIEEWIFRIVIIIVAFIAFLSSLTGFFVYDYVPGRAFYEWLFNVQEK